ncbi:MAG: sigma-70 family RNA polymerase sigma factor [Phycisphaerales bacterium]|nr:sigma-70 family RNA polymerase sigma factor [Phycisphaerales bacterium]
MRRRASVIALIAVSPFGYRVPDALRAGSGSSRPVRGPAAARSRANTFSDSLVPPSSPLTDEQLIDQVRGGDRTAFRTLIERYQQELLNFLIRLVGDRAAAEDVFQEAFLQVHQSLGSFDLERTFRPWLFTIAANKGRDYLRKKGRQRTVDLSAPVSGVASAGDEASGATFVDLMHIDLPGPDQALDAQERDRRVQEAVQSLPLSLREILLLSYFQRLSYAQIADELQIPLGTVKSRLHAAVASFAKKWKSLNNEDGSR